MSSRNRVIWKLNLRHRLLDVPPEMAEKWAKMRRDRRVELTPRPAAAANEVESKPADSDKQA